MDAAADKIYRRLFIYDPYSKANYLIDSGAAISIIPRKKTDKPCQEYLLYAANGTPIPTYGEERRDLSLGLRRKLPWIFVKAEVTQPILGADFLAHYKLLVDLSNKCLIDGITGLRTKGKPTNNSGPVISTIPTDTSYYKLLAKFPDLSRPSSQAQITSREIFHHIETRGPPVTCKARRLPPGRYQAAKEEFSRMMEAGICRPSKSPWSSPLHIVDKKDGSIRPCGDYRLLNSKTVPDRYAVPNLLDFTNILEATTIYSTLDIRQAYHLIPVAEEDIPKTAILTPFGLYEFTKMTFGLRNAAQTFQRFIDHIFRDLSFVFVFLDDILIASRDASEHEEHLYTVLQRLSEHGLVLNIEKCKLGKPEVTFLGYKINAAGIEPLKEKVRAISEYPRPQNISQLRRFLGMVNFYRKSLPKAAEIQRPLNRLLHGAKKRDKTPIIWTEETIRAFEATRLSLHEAARLAHPLNEATLVLSCDASDTAMGAALQQISGEDLQPLGFFSRALNSAQKNYSTYDKELLAIYEAIRHFRQMIEARPLIVYTDHKALTHAMLQKSDTASPRRLRQLNFISQFTTDIRYQKGEANIVADALSRVEEISLPGDYRELSEAQQTDEQAIALLITERSNFAHVQIPGTDFTLLCEIETGTPRPYLPEKFRKPTFNRIHNLCHPGIRSTRRLISRRFYWPGMNKDIGEWVRYCQPCQKAKVHRNTVTPVGSFPPSGKLEHVHLDIIGPLPPSDGKRFCLTIMDRATGWPEAIPLTTISAEVIGRVFYEKWISRFGIPIRITTDQGRQFESQLFQQLTKLLGIQRIRTTAYHPQSNGMLERWHRSFKASLMSHLLDTAAGWTKYLPTVLLGLRATLRKGTNASAAEMLYGQTIRLPGEFFTASPTVTDDTLDSLRQHHRIFRGTDSQKKIFVPQDLNTCTHIFLKTPLQRRALEPPYRGPYEVINRNEKNMTIKMQDKEVLIPLDRVKPAFLIKEDVTSISIAPETKEEKRNMVRFNTTVITEAKKWVNSRV